MITPDVSSGETRSVYRVLQFKCRVIIQVFLGRGRSSTLRLRPEGGARATKSDHAP